VPRCSFDGRLTSGKVQGPSWQPDTDGDGRVWLVYRDDTFPGGVPGLACDPDSYGHLIWAVEVDLAQPAAWNPLETQLVHLPSPEPYPWKGYQAVWSGDGLHLAAIQWPNQSLGYSQRQLIVYDVEFTWDGLPQLVNPWSLTPDADHLKGQVYDIAWANWSDTLVVTAEAVWTDPSDIWMCDVDFGSRTCAEGWTNLTPDNAFDLRGAGFSNDDSEILVSLLHDGANKQPVADLFVGSFVPFAPLELQLLVPAPRFMWLIHPDWRALPAP
jgi:hypothetical protein